HLLQMWSSRVNAASKKALLAWEKETGIKLVQINGQRHYGGPPPGWVGDPPPASTEVYISRLPQDVYENTLIPLFESVGKLYEFRLMMTFSGLNRGFAYARYASLQDAQSAIATFHHFELRKGCSIIVCRSTQKCQLLVTGLDTLASQQELEASLQKVTEGLCSVTMHAVRNQGQAKVAVLKYSSHNTAALAKKALLEGNPRLREAGMRVDWLEPQEKKLQLYKEEPLSSWAQGGKNLAVPRPLAPHLMLQDLERPNTLCWKRHLRTPLFMTRRVQVNPNGCQKFWYQVVIPGSHEPISGFTSILPDQQSQSEHEKAKLLMALHILQVLGESL
ncbi:DND1 protein, partial [Spelaeornis formosus]|nr:DND1 protein [Elachura formosa]